MTRRITNSAFGVPTLHAPATGKPRSALTTSAGTSEMLASKKGLPTNYVIPLEPGSGGMEHGRTTLRGFTNSAALVQAIFARGGAWPKHRAVLLVDGILA